MDRAAFDAGGLVPEDGSTVDLEQADRVLAREYRHGGLVGRVVVRLVSADLAVGEDALAAVCGFAPAGDAPPVALRRRRTLGFPHWTLVHDPKNSARALALLPLFRKLGRQASSKPGHARDAFVEMARGLERAAPAVLPTFHEQVARVFVEVGNLKFAATFFDKARAAEASFGLRVDPARTAEAFLEFALVGAVTVKSIQTWIKEVAAADGAAPALERFLALSVGRTHGGLPPWAAFAKDLARLATAAGSSTVEAQARWLAEVVSSPGLERTPAAVWEELQPAVTLLAGRPGAAGRDFRAALAMRFPTAATSRWDDLEPAFAERWLGVLHGCGALAEVRDGPRPLDWLRRFLSWTPTFFGPSLQVIRWFGPHLRGAALELERDWVDPDVVDLLLELGAGITLTEGTDLRLRSWASGVEVAAANGMPAEVRPRDLEFALAHPTFGAELRRLLPRVLDEEAFGRVARARPAIARLRLEALRELLRRVVSAPTPEAVDALEALAELSFAELSQEPQLAPELAALSAGPALAAALRGGVFEEQWWPAFEAARAELGAEDPKVAGAWPFLVVAAAHRAIVLGPDGERHTAIDLKVPAGGELRAVRWLDGALLIGWDTDDGERACWSTDQRDLFEVDIPYYSEDLQPGFPLPGGGVFVGSGVVRRGDRGWPEALWFLSDGEQVWTVDDERIAKVDPATGRAVAGPPPSFLADALPEHLSSAWLSWDARGPLGLRRAGDAYETLDGHRFEGSRPEWIGGWPGDRAVRAVGSTWRNVVLFTADGSVVDEAPQSECLPALGFWKAVPRDPAASAFLRSVSADDAHALLALVPVAAEADAIGGVVGQQWPVVSDPRLRSGVVRQVARAAALRERLAAWRLGEGAADEVPDGVLSLDDYQKILGLAAPPDLDGGYFDLVRVIREERAFLTGTRDVAPAAADQSVWALWPGVRAVGWALSRPGLPETERAAIRSVLQALGEGPPIRVRVADWTFPDLTSPFLRTTLDGGERNLVEDWVVVEPETRFVVHTNDTWSDEGPFDVQTRSVGPGDPAGAAVVGQGLVEQEPDALRWVRALLEADPRRTITPEDALRVAEATGLSAPAATLLLAAGPGFHAWSNWLGDYREVLQLKVKEADAARDELRRLGLAPLHRVLLAAAPEDPAGFATSLVEPLVNAFLAEFGRQVPVAPELRIAAEKDLGSDWILSALASPTSQAGLAADATYTVDADLDISVVGEQPGFDADHVGLVVQGVPWVVGTLPGGHPLRANLRRVMELLLARLAAPGLWLAAGRAWADDARQARKWLDVVVGQGDTREVPGLRVGVRDDMLLAIACPAQFGDEALAAATALAARTSDDEFRELPVALSYLPRLRRWADYLATETLPIGALASNPEVTAPDLVASAAAKWKLSREAAVLYLQTLALLNPTKKSVCEWNGWTGSVYERAGKALVAAKLAVEGKRPRAGRTYFLPGGWVEARPAPYERWKLPLLDGTERRSELVLPFPTPLAVHLPHEAFALAWKRIVAGDLPRFE